MKHSAWPSPPLQRSLLVSVPPPPRQPVSCAATQKGPPGRWAEGGPVAHKPACGVHLAGAAHRERQVPVQGPQHVWGRPRGDLIVSRPWDLGGALTRGEAQFRILGFLLGSELLRGEEGRRPGGSVLPCPPLSDPFDCSVPPPTVLRGGWTLTYFLGAVLFIFLLKMI